MMKRMLALIAAAALGALTTLFAVNFAPSSFAQVGAPPTSGMPANGGYGRGQTMGRGQMGGQGQMGNHGQLGGQGQLGGSTQSLVGMVAAELGLNQADLISQLGDTGTMAAALTAGGIDPAAFVERFVALRAEHLETALSAGTLTQSDVEARLATARSMATARLYQPFTQLGPGGQSPFERPAGMGQGRMGGHTCQP